MRTIVPATQGRGGSWGKDGTILFAPNIDSGLYQVAADGGEAKPVELSGGREATRGCRRSCRHRSPLLPRSRYLQLLTLGTGRGYHSPCER